MKSNKLSIGILCVLIAVFLSIGIWQLMKNVNIMQTYSDGRANAQQALVAADPANAEGLEAELAALQAENESLEETAAALQDEGVALDAENAQMQQEYDELSQQEDVVYYQTILESLKEGMSLVESYINGAE